MIFKNSPAGNAAGRPSLTISLLPIIVLLGTLLSIIVFAGAGRVADLSPYLLLGAAAVGTVAAMPWFKRSAFLDGMGQSLRQTLPAVPMLLLIGTLSATWMFSGVVPIFIEYGLAMINPRLFLAVACCVCAFISILTGSSWTTVATIGVAFMGIGEVLGYSPAWIAGAIISGAYFGDKVSPLSDTTVLAASSCRVDLFKHIRYMLLTTAPSIVVAIAVFVTVGFLSNPEGGNAESEVVQLLDSLFYLSPWIMVIPALTLILILCKVNTLLTLSLSTVLGLVGVVVFQPDLLTHLSRGSGLADKIMALGHMLVADTGLQTGNPTLDDLISTGGMQGMMPTVFLVLAAMVFGGVMMGTGMLSTIASALTGRLRGRTPVVGATAVGGLFLNSVTADQYLSLIVGGNIYRPVYERSGLEGRLLSRTLEDSVSVTSVLIPWNSCGVTQSAVLGVATMTYFPCCVFNWISPLMSVLMARLGFKIVVGRSEMRAALAKA